ncbi:MAG: hypothetical protein ACW990_14595 [Promethearchaeota archaeon]|jgi:hypothetical protein
MLKSVNVRVSRKDEKDPEKVITSFENVLINTDVVALIEPIPSTKTSLIKLINGNAILAKGELKALEKSLSK